MRHESNLSWLKHLLDQDNPFIPWLTISLAVLLLVHVAIVWWVYRDALQRYNRGAPWATLAAVLPLAGWLFYLLYRISPLVQFDRIEAELFDPDEHEWTDYDRHRADRNKKLFKEISSFVRRPEGSGYSPWTRLGRERELKRKLSPEEKRDALIIRRQRELEAQKRKDEKRSKARDEKQRQLTELKERRTVTGLHGSRLKMGFGKQRRIKRKLELSEKLKLLPREDVALEELIYAGDYAGALSEAQGSLGIAKEMGDKQGIITYRSYLERLELLIDADRAAPDA